MIQSSDPLLVVIMALLCTPFVALFYKAWALNKETQIITGALASGRGAAPKSKYHSRFEPIYDYETESDSAIEAAWTPPSDDEIAFAPSLIGTPAVSDTCQPKGDQSYEQLKLPFVQ